MRWALCCMAIEKLEKHIRLLSKKGERFARSF